MLDGKGSTMQVNLGLGRPVQSEDLLGVGSWLLLQDQSDQNKDPIRSELSRLFGQLSMLNVRDVLLNTCNSNL
jgi:hypothetical protein